MTPAKNKTSPRPSPKGEGVDIRRSKVVMEFRKRLTNL